MNKREYLDALRRGLSGLPQADVDERLAFYGEMIDDRVEDGMSEEDAFGQIGDIDTVVSQTLSEIPLTKLVKERMKRKKYSAWEIVLLVIGAVVWLPLLIAAGAVVLSVYLAAWACIAAFWASFAALALAAAGGVFAGAVLLVKRSFAGGLALIGCALCLAGLSILAFFACLAVTKGMIRLTKAAAIGLKRRFVKKEDAE